MDYQEFIKKIDLLATKYGYTKVPDEDITDCYDLKCGKTKSCITIFNEKSAGGTYDVDGFAQGLQEYITIEGKHLIEKVQDRFTSDKFEDFDYDKFENWLKIQAQIVGRHNKYLRDKEIEKKIKKAQKDF